MAQNFTRFVKKKKLKIYQKRRNATQRMTTATRRRFVRVNNPSYPEFAVGYEEGDLTSIKVSTV